MIEKNIIGQLAEILFRWFEVTLQDRPSSPVGIGMFSGFSLAVDDIGHGGFADTEFLGDFFVALMLSPHFEDGCTFFRAKVAFYHKN
jgi:hypothetical protein